MQDLPANETTLPEVLAAMAHAGKVRLLNEHREAIAIVEPAASSLFGSSDGPSPRRESTDSFSEAMAEYRRTHDVKRNGVTTEEVESWRDKSPGRESPF